LTHGADGFGARNARVLLFAIFLIAAGEQLWLPFAPRYLQALGAGIYAVAAFGVVKDLLDAIYQFPGGALTAWLGAKRSLLLFNLLAVAGYAAFALSRTWWLLLLALPLVMAWQSFSLPATFSIVAASMPKSDRSTALAWQSIVRRVPIAVAPAIGGALIGAYGVIAGSRVALAVSILLGLGAMVLQAIAYDTGGGQGLRFRDALAGATQLDPLLKRLLVSDMIVRFGQGIGEIFIVLYAIGVLGASPQSYGWLIGLAMVTSIAVYLPAARRADAGSRAPWVTLTYLFFAAFPLALAATTSAAWLPVAFVLMGLREIGEPPRKALIVELSREGRKSVDVGAYYFARGLAVFPASLVGGALWHVGPRVTFLAAGILAATGAAAFWWLVQRRNPA
jgi:MFS family permease